MKESGGGGVWPTTPKTGSTSQNYYSIHVKPDLNSLDFSIYSVSVGPSCAKNTVACLTLAHSVTVGAQRVLTQRYFSGDSKLVCVFCEIMIPARRSAGVRVDAPLFLFIYLSMYADNSVVFV